MVPRPPGRESVTCPSCSVSTSPEETERIMKVKPGQGTEEEEGLGEGSRSSVSGRKVAMLSGGVKVV